MNRPTLFGVMFSGFLLCTAAFAQEATGTLDVRASGIHANKPMSARYAHCMPDGRGATKDSQNISPAISWTAGPAGTKSYAMMVVDKDAPGDMSLINQSDKTIAADAARQDFYQWVVVDIPFTTNHLPQNAKDKIGVAGQNNNSTQSGYDGPCPPWNDARAHHYHFEVFALDVATLNMKAPFSGQQASEAMRPHILAKGEVVGTYTTNPTNPTPTE